MALIQYLSLALAALVSFVAILYKSLGLRIEVLGINRVSDTIENIHGEGLRVLPDTLYMEDVHHHIPSGLLFGASEEKAETRWKWFPPIGRLNAAYATDRGTIVVIDPQTQTTKRLTLPNFPKPFITHGIDIHSSPTSPTTVLVFAVNHVANPSPTASNGTLLPPARSQIELFRHTIGSTEAIHLRSIWHPLIRTPNDIYAIDSHSFYVTNDHYYRSGKKRLLEDVGFGLTPWSDVIHISLSSLTAEDSTEGVTATIAIPKIQNPNGLGHGKTPNELLLIRSVAGELQIRHQNLTTIDTIQFPNTLDNPSYFHDPYAKATGHDASGYVLPGLAVATKFPTKRDPVVVWLVQPRSKEQGGYDRKKIFQDDGGVISTASAAVLVAINPEENGGKKQAWLFVTGPMSMNAISTKIDL